MQRPPTRAELEHERRRQHERLVRQPSVITVSVVVVSVAVALYTTVGILAVVAMVGVCAAGAYAVL
jgi:hypothetical protein